MSGETNLKQQHEDYLSWCLMSAEERAEAGLPNSKAKYAEHIDVSIQTLQRWQKLPEFVERYEKALKERQGSPERAQAALDNLYDRGMAGDNKAMELWMKATGLLVAAPAPPAPRKIAELSDEELRELIREKAATELAARQTQPDNVVKLHG